MITGIIDNLIQRIDLQVVDRIKALVPKDEAKVFEIVSKNKAEFVQHMLKLEVPEFTVN